MAIDLTKIGIYSGVNDSVQKISNLRLGRNGNKKVVTQAYAGINNTPQLVYDFLDEIEYMVLVIETMISTLEEVDDDGDGEIDYWHGSSVDSKEEWNCNLSFTNPTSTNKYSCTINFSLKTRFNHII